MLKRTAGRAFLLFAALLLIESPALAVRFEILRSKQISPGFFRVIVKYPWEPGVFNTDEYDVNCNARSATFQGVAHIPMGDTEGLLRKVCGQ